MKTESTVRDDLYDFISKSSIKNFINGHIYKYDGERPDKSRKEDLVIAPLTDTPISQLQELIVNVRIYVSKLYDSENNLYRADSIRLRAIEDTCKKTFKVFKTNDARCILESIKTFDVDGKNEQCIVNRINYKFCNN